MKSTVRVQKRGQKAVFSGNELGPVEVIVLDSERISRKANDKRATLEVREAQDIRKIQITPSSGLVEVASGVSVGIASIEKDRGAVSLYYSFPDSYSVLFTRCY
ncbi:hypothetical protein CO038_01725 [Candidatus Pacearchaeota archaeon CG_4_9_14_0_2_um_filter_39_13]|nr:hypothetical protein [Candidatus Pacearchaeota archaeon]OIO42475.1 MAG: hypothetical protein AUJ64_04170 [Candidatus Pacearchaeota archaeon CG1_02_39_14]PJC44848.1 MAG: hypothetical protein CO038_01725 [Candidatus Pacearchaeota archaeon CG_4_9_14_0_2_um_filter_39_13]